MEIKDTRVYGLEKSIIVSGYPMSIGDEGLRKQGYSDKDLKRAKKLGCAKVGSGHDCFLKGIIVQADFTAPQYWWLQFQRYHFADIVSSQSKMHRIVHMDISNQCNEYVLPEAIQLLQKLVEEYKENPSDELFQQIVSNTPMGLQLTAGIVTNYLQLKTMYYQRRNHKLKEWKKVCDWIEGLPCMKDMVLV
ncbi:MAG: hypothetical protein PHP06_00400 [Clostridia bacterium]|nr:hypothetical protein [Clostridia bacterium]